MSDVGTSVVAAESAPPPGRARRREWLVIIVAAVVAVPLWNWRGTWNQPGMTTSATITLVTSDREDLACALGRRVDGYRCGFQGNTEPWGDPPAPAQTLAPYMTVNRQMYLVPALFEQPAIAARYQQEPPANIPRERLKRFEAICTLRLREKVDQFKVRWEAGGSWGSADAAWMAEPSDCRVKD
jgi:hypothetical protein